MSVNDVVSNTDMSDHSRFATNLPPEQEAIRAKCFHPTGTFVEFKREEVEQSIMQRFEQMVSRYPNVTQFNVGRGSKAARRHQRPSNKVRNLYE